MFALQSTKTTRDRSPLRRAGVLAVLLCWLWFSAAAPFGHRDFLRPVGDPVAITSDDGRACVTCQWYACVGSTGLTTPPALPPVYPAAIAVRIGKAAPPASPVYLLPSRAPPA